MPRNTLPGDPLAGLKMRRARRGLPNSTPTPTPSTATAPLEWWQVIENQTAREVAAARRKGLI